MTSLKIAATIFGLAILGVACGSSSNNSTDVPIYGGTGGSHADAPITSTGGAGGATVGVDSGAGGAGGTTVAVDSGAGGSAIDAPHIDSGAGGGTGTVDGGGAGGGTGTVDSGAIDGGGAPTKDGHIAIINAPTTSVGLTVTGPAAVAYTSCK
jgi:hypothetical protein